MLDSYKIKENDEKEVKYEELTQQLKITCRENNISHYTVFGKESPVDVRSKRTITLSKDEKSSSTRHMTTSSLTKSQIND